MLPRYICFSSKVADLYRYILYLRIRIRHSKKNWLWIRTFSVNFCRTFILVIFEFFKRYFNYVKLIKIWFSSCVNFFDFLKKISGNIEHPDLYSEYGSGSCNPMNTDPDLQPWFLGLHKGLLIFMRPLYRAFRCSKNEILLFCSHY